MTPHETDDSVGLDDRFTSRLVDFDDRLVAGAKPPCDDGELPDDLRRQLDAARACVLRVEAALPRPPSGADLAEPGAADWQALASLVQQIAAAGMITPDETDRLLT